MNYEQFTDLWPRALRESGLPQFVGEPLRETLDLRSADRKCLTFLHVHSDPAPTFNVSAELGFG